ncbi:hypothetical protein Glove_420g77 [Diversispora epigaea]|uniref:Protein kinase domain-containing protein n=1 Tax=Diversispora epigaea TaxID=1348612 RepID=A0A397H3X7_9GLOM|nr:hypothetical protein Glove_420g77 [Diversispora epigaea]
MEKEVVLKKFDGTVDINKKFLNEIDSNSLENKRGSLRNYLNNNNVDWDCKLLHLSNLANRFSEIHKLDIVHPGNILKYNSYSGSIYISDFGLSKLITDNLKNSKKNTISGVLPYMAPEVLIRGEYTKAADVYSFAFVASEIITGLPPYHDVSREFLKSVMDFDQKFHFTHLN